MILGAAVRGKVKPESVFHSKTLLIIYVCYDISMVSCQKKNLLHFVSSKNGSLPLRNLPKLGLPVQMDTSSSVISYMNIYDTALYLFIFQILKYVQNATGFIEISYLH